VTLNHVLDFIDKRETFSVSLSSLVINTFTQVAIILKLALVSSYYCNLLTSCASNSWIFSTHVSASMMGISRSMHEHDVEFIGVAGIGIGGIGVEGVVISPKYLYFCNK
jgi:hypothetical protein